MAVRVYISYANVDTEWQYRIGTLSGTDATGERNTFSVTVFSSAGSNVPIVGQPIRICDDTLGNLFGGTINEVVATFFQGSGAVDLALSCSSWDALCDRHDIEEAQTYTATAAGDVIRAIFALSTIKGEGVYLTNVVSGPSITASFQYQTVASALDTICQMCPGYYWKIDADKVLTFGLLSGTAAPFNFTEHSDHMLGPPTITWTREKYANRFIGVLTKYIGDTTTEQLQGDGVSKDFNVSAPIAEIPTISVCSAVYNTASLTETFSADGSRTDYYLPTTIYSVSSVTLNGSPQSVGTSGSDWNYISGTSVISQNVPAAGTVVVEYDHWDGTFLLGTPVVQTVGASGGSGFQWYWTAESTTVSQDALETTLTGDEAVVVVYKPLMSQTIYKSNTSEIAARAAIEGGTGLYTEVWTYGDQIGFAAADAMAQGYVTNYSSIPLIFEQSTRYIGITSGQHLTVTISNVRLTDGSYPLVSTTFVVQSVGLQDVNGDLRWNIRAVNGALIPYGYQALAQMMTSPSSGVSGGGGQGPPGASGDPIIQPSTY